MEGRVVYSKHTSKEGGGRPFWQKGPPEIGIEFNVGAGSQHRRRLGKGGPRLGEGWAREAAGPTSCHWLPHPDQPFLLSTSLASPPSHPEIRGPCPPAPYPPPQAPGVPADQ